MEKKALEQMISRHAYDEIVSKIKNEVGEGTFAIIFPSIKKALEEGDGKTRSEILIDWLDCDSIRVCSYCGALMEEGWYLDSNGYACSDKCAAESEGITMEEFDRYQIYKDDLIEYLDFEGEGRKLEDLSKEEISDIINNSILDGVDYFYTEWY
jgi:hypothetical protein